MKKGAIIASIGIGDALLMSIAAYALYRQGYSVTLFHDGKFSELKRWFPYLTIEKYPKDEHAFISFDLVIVQNDNSPKMKKLCELREKHIVPNLSIFYATYKAIKNAPLTSLDFVFKTGISMAENIAEACFSLLKLKETSKENGLNIPEGLIHRDYLRRIIIHPTSSHPSKNWPKEKFIELGKKLLKKGFQVTFSLSSDERKHWLSLHEQGFDVPLLPSLDDLASLIYESGYLIGNDSAAGHLASCFAIPTLILGISEKHMNLWRPDWLRGEIVTPPSYIPNLKGLRIREKKWQSFISVSKTLKSFDKIVYKYSNN